MTRNRTKVWDLNYVTVIMSATTKPWASRPAANTKPVISELLRDSAPPSALRSSGLAEVESPTDVDTDGVDHAVGIAQLGLAEVEDPTDVGARGVDLAVNFQTLGEHASGDLSSVERQPCRRVCAAWPR